MVSKFICCFSLKTGYNLTGLFYSTVSIIAFTYLYKSLETFYAQLLISVFYLGNVIAFGLPAFYWTLDLFLPKYKYKRMFYLLFKWLTLTWAILITSFFLMFYTLLFIDEGDLISFNFIVVVLLLCIAFGAVALPNAYISKRLKAYIDSTQAS